MGKKIIMPTVINVLPDSLSSSIRIRLKREGITNYYDYREIITPFGNGETGFGLAYGKIEQASDDNTHYALYPTTDIRGYKLNVITWPTINIVTSISLANSGMIEVKEGRMSQCDCYGYNPDHGSYYIGWQWETIEGLFYYNNASALDHELVHQRHLENFWEKQLKPLIKWSETYDAGFFLDLSQAHKALASDIDVNLKQAIDVGTAEFENAIVTIHDKGGGKYVRYLDLVDSL